MVGVFNFITEELVKLVQIAIIFRIIGSVGILLVFWLFRRVFTNYIFNVLIKVTSKTKSHLDDHLVLAFKKPLQIFFVALGIYLAFIYLKLDPSYNLFAARFFRSTVIVLVAIGLYNLAGRYDALCEELERVFSFKVDKILIPFFSKTLKAIVILLALSMIAEEWSYNVTGFVAGLGLGGLAFALAAKDTLANIFGGLVVIIDKPFSIGDWILTSVVEGVVEDINFRSTRVRTFAQSLVTVPNSHFANEAITNWSRMGMRRVNFKLGVTYSTPKYKLEQCINEIKEMLIEHPDINNDMIFVHFESFAASSLDILLYFFTNTIDWGGYLRVKEDVNLRIMEILEKQGVSVAFPSTTVYLERETLEDGQKEKLQAETF